MPKIGMGKKKDVFPGRKGTSWSRTSLMREGIGSSPSCQLYACHTSGGRYPGARRAVVQLAPMWNYERRTHLSACAC